jgi:hypothetical protein
VACCGSGDLCPAWGIDTWGVDYALLDAQGELLGNPYHYRDERTEGTLDESLLAACRAPRCSGATGIQFMDLNTLFQLFAARAREPALQQAAKPCSSRPTCSTTGCRATRSTNTPSPAPASASSRSPARGPTGLLAGWASPLHIFGEIVQPGTVLGPLLPWVAEETAARGVKLVAVGTPRHRLRRRRGPRRRPRPRICQLRHVVDPRRREPQPVVNSRALAVQLHQRGRRLRHDPADEEHHRALDHPGVPPAVGARGRQADVG